MNKSIILSDSHYRHRSQKRIEDGYVFHRCRSLAGQECNEWIKECIPTHSTANRVEIPGRVNKTVQLPLTNQRKRACFTASVVSDLPKMRKEKIILNRKIYKMFVLCKSD